jgi:glutaredoxin-related protein
MRTIIIYLLCCLFLSASIVSADTIVLKNGKEFEGNIIGVKGSVVKMEKPSGDTFVIKVKQIQSVDSQDMTPGKQTLLSDIQSQLKQAGPAQAAGAVGRRTNPDDQPEVDTSRKKYEAPEYQFIKKPVLKGVSDLSAEARENEGDEEDEDDSTLGEITRGRFKKTVELFVSPSCPDCDKLEEDFKKSDIEYKRYDITASPNAKSRYERYRVNVVPLTVVDGEKSLGYNPDHIKYLLKKDR